MKKTAFSLGKRLLVISICVLLVALTACGGTPTPSPTPTPKPPTTTAVAPPTTAASTAPPSKVVVVKPPVTGPPRIPGGQFLLMPKDGATVESNTLYSQVDYANINIMPPSATNKEGEGHINFYLDVDPIPIEAGKAAILPSPKPEGYKGKIYIGYDANVQQQQAYIWKGVPNGAHIFGAQLVQNDNTPFNPPIWGKAAVTIKGEFPGGTPTVVSTAKPVTVKATITSFAPTSGGVGTKVVVTGKEFSVVSRVTVGDVVINPTNYTVDSTTQITVTLPAVGTSGKVVVTTASGVAASADSFTFK